MQRIYSTSDGSRAHEIHDLMERHGIPAEIHGMESARMVRHAHDGISVWLLHDEDLGRAQQTLVEFLKKEAAELGTEWPPKRMNGTLRSTLLVVAAFAACLLALAAAYGF